ncbi:glycosyltransferase family 2 protein [Synechococcus sp. 1G10]|uniref:glycosyltransferase n=1 Tax=Synechococcus sp. 1G10 TaxID=2025605 RepID=UPI000B9959C9|nr:glycosyltransferase family 2 protein [Synechococcus sp. 1G10]
MSKLSPLRYAIVIPTCGRTHQLQMCLESVQSQLKKYKEFEAIVINNNYEESLILAVNKIARNFPVATVVECSLPGLSSARHAALRVTEADVLCFLDDDVILSDEWCASTIKAFRDKGADLAGGPSIPVFSSSVPSWFWDLLAPTPYGGWSCTWLSLLDIGRDVDGIHPNWIWGLNFAIRRQVLIDCGGFHVDLVPPLYRRWQGDGETGLTMKIAKKGFKAVYRQSSLLFHQCGSDRLNSDYFTKRACYQGICNSYAELRSKLREETLVTPTRKPSLIKQALRRSIISLKKHLYPSPSVTDLVTPWAASAAEFRELWQQAERDGYLFHQREAEQDPVLREWIRRENYFDVDLRDFNSGHEQPPAKDK